MLIQDYGKQPYPLGERVPLFENLRGIDNRRYALADFDRHAALVMIFTCNHCPYAQAYEDRLIQLAHDFKPHNIAFLAINSNHAEDYPEDSFENMVTRAAYKGYPYPYVYDESQQVAHDFHAVCTPHAFVVQQRSLVYRGRIDDSWMRPDRVTRQDLRNALEALVSGRPIEVAHTYPMGCSIKWKTQEAGNPDRAIAREMLQKKTA